MGRKQVLIVRSKPEGETLEKRLIHPCQGDKSWGLEVTPTGGRDQPSEQKKRDIKKGSRGESLNYELASRRILWKKLRNEGALAG